MTTNVSINDETLTIFVSGAINSLTAPDLENVVRTNYNDSIKNVVFDLKDCNYISSAGLRVILLSKKMANTKDGNVSIENPQDSVKEVFELTGFFDFLEHTK